MIRAALFALGLLFLGAHSAAAEERIEHFVSDVTVNRDASLDVRETITVNAEGNEIRRGILRDFPTIYTDHNGVRLKVGFEVLEVTRNGRSEPYALESLSNGVRIRIGDKDVYLDNGQQTYELRYQTTRQLGFFDTYDELYWNVTGNGWTFPIQRATSIIRLPPGARIEKYAAYTGPEGASGGDYTVLNGNGAEFRAETTQRLESYQGFTVAIGWQKGIVTPPTSTDQWGWWISDNAGYFALLLSLAASGLYYLYAWDKVGRDPPGGTIVPLFRPPEGLGPAGARFIREHGIDDRGFAAALVSLAVKHHLKIEDDDGDFSITRLAPPTSGATALTSAERALYSALPGGTTALKQANHVKVRAARSALANALKAEYEGTVFLRNLSWFWKGAILSILGLIGSALLLPVEQGVTGLFAVAWTGIWWTGVLAFIWSAIKGFGSARGIVGKLGSIFGMLFIIPFIGGGLMAPAMIFFGAGSSGLYGLVAGAVVLGLMNLLFYYLLRAPTIPGRKILDQLEGFRMYMTTAEEERLKVLHPPEKTPELFERYLPYALALDCENEWNAKFATVLAAAAAAGAAAPIWYSGNHWNGRDMGSFTDSLGSSLTSSVSSASTAPGSRSGSGGGGSSGGGGGGGGGSGW